MTIAVQTRIVRIGNPQRIRIPKPLLGRAADEVREAVLATLAEIFAP